MGFKGTGNRSGSIPAKENLVDIWSSFKANPQRRRQWDAVGIGESAMLRASFVAIRGILAYYQCNQCRTKFRLDSSQFLLINSNPSQGWVLPTTAGRKMWRGAVARRRAASASR